MNQGREPFSHEQSTNERKSVYPFVFWFMLLVGLLLTAQIIAVPLMRHVSNMPATDLGIQPFKNYHFAFSLPLSGWLLYGVYVVVMIILIRYLVASWYQLSGLQRCAWVLILAGAVSNIGERVVLGYVRDYFYVYSGIFNIADLYIFLGVGMLLYWELRQWYRSRQVNS
jgi:signal peptidase II